MKKKILSLVSVSIVIILCLVSCNTVDAEGLWEDAKYRRDVTVGKGDTTIELEVKAGEESVTITVKTDKTMLGEALLEAGVIEGYTDTYGLYVTKVNGILADFDADGAYWALYKNGEYSLTGVDSTPIADGEHYELVYTVYTPF